MPTRTSTKDVALAGVAALVEVAVDVGQRLLTVGLESDPFVDSMAKPLPRTSGVGALGDRWELDGLQGALGVSLFGRRLRREACAARRPRRRRTRTAPRASVPGVASSALTPAARRASREGEDHLALPVAHVRRVGGVGGAHPGAEREAVGHPRVTGRGPCAEGVLGGELAVVSRPWPSLPAIASGVAITATAARPRGRERGVAAAQAVAAAAYLGGGERVHGAVRVVKLSSSSIGSGMAESFLVGEQGGEGGAAAAEPGLDGSLGDADLAGHVVDRAGRRCGGAPAPAAAPRGAA